MYKYKQRLSNIGKIAACSLAIALFAGTSTNVFAADGDDSSTQSSAVANNSSITSSSSESSTQSSSSDSSAKPASVDQQSSKTKQPAQDEETKPTETSYFNIQNVSGYATVISNSTRIWSDMGWTSSISSSKYFHNTLHYDQIATLNNGSRYARLVSNAGSVIGFINVKCVGRTSLAKGVAVEGIKYATITQKSGDVYKDWEGHVAAPLSKYYHSTFKIERTYYHNNGVVYYSLYNYSGKWVGYVTSDAVTMSGNGFTGAPIATNRYVTVMRKGITIYSNLHWKKLTNTSSKIFNTYRVMKEYHHGSGSIYYQLVDKKGYSKGFVNSVAVKQASGEQGLAIGYLKSVSLVSSSIVWKDFGWHKASKQYANLKGQRLQVKRYYHHFNGSTYYSIYTTSGSWIGYVNAGGTKNYVAPAPAKPLWLRPSENKPYPNLKKYPNAYFSVSQKAQRVYIKAANGKTLYTMICSTGLGNNTPNGWYKIQAERGTAFSGANYWTSWLNHGQYLFHTVIVNHDRSYNVAAAKKLGHKASHGCIRLPVPDAIWIYKNAPVGMRVHIY